MTNPTYVRIAAAGLVLAPLLFTLADLLRRLVEPTGTPSATAITDAVGRHGGAWLAAGGFSVVAALCFVPAMVGVIATAHGRGARITTAGAVVVGIGAVASTGHAAAFYSPYALFDRAGTADSAIRSLDHASEGYPLLIALIVLFAVGMALGPILLFVGLRRARRVPVRSVVAAIVFVACGSTGGVGAGALGVAAALAAFIPAARSLLTSAPPRHDSAAPAVVTHA